MKPLDDTIQMTPAALAALAAQVSREDVPDMDWLGTAIDKLEAMVGVKNSVDMLDNEGFDLAAMPWKVA